MSPPTFFSVFRLSLFANVQELPKVIDRLFCSFFFFDRNRRLTAPLFQPSLFYLQVLIWQMYFPHCARLQLHPGSLHTSLGTCWSPDLRNNGNLPFFPFFPSSIVFPPPVPKLCQTSQESLICISFTFCREYPLLFKLTCWTDFFVFFCLLSP